MTGGSAAVTKVGAIVIACLLILYGGTAYVAPLAAASSPKPTATAPEQLVHAFPLGPQRLCCTKGSRVHPTAGSPTTRSRSVGHLGGAKTDPGSSSAIWIVVLGVGVLLLLATAEAIHKTRRRAPVRAPGAENGRAWGSAETARSASTAPNEWSEGGRASNLRFLVHRRGDPEGAREIAAVESAEAGYRRADEASDAVGAFNLGVLLQQRRDLEGARAAYERAERRGDPDAAFNLGVLLYDAGDLDGAEAAWRRSVHHGHPHAAANLCFLLQQRGDPEGAREIAGMESAEQGYRRADEAGDAGGAFNLGALLQQRRDLVGARSAYERAERRGDPDAAFNLGVLLYDAGDVDGAEAAWRRSVHHGHPRAAANLRFLLQRRGDPEGALDTTATTWRRTYRQPRELPANGPKGTSDNTAAAASAGTTDSTHRTR